MLRQSLRRCANTRSISLFSHTYRSLKTLVVGEHEGGVLKQSTRNAIAAAHILDKGTPLSLLMAGSGPSLHQAADQASAIHPSVSQVFVVDSKNFQHPLAESWGDLIHFVQEKDSYSHIVAASNSFGKNVLPRAAALLNVSPITDIVQIIAKNIFVRPIYAGNAFCTVHFVGLGPCIMSIRSTSFLVPDPLPLSNADKATISTIDTSDLSSEMIGKSTWLRKSAQEAERPDLSNARIIITGGRGLKNAENFKMLEKLADKLGAAVGASRAAVDAGFVPNELQVGQTGKIVAPELYIAFGISGAIQHLAGMKDSKVIVAVNKDADAPIFQVADYGLVADIFQVIPELLEKLPEKK